MNDTSALISETPHAVLFAANDEVLAVFDELKIFFDSRINQPRSRAPIYFPRRASVEPYTQFPARQLFSCGAFSYCETVAVPPLSSVGRFCSIARGLDVFGVRHPLEWVTDSSITYDFNDLDGYSVWVAAQRDLMGNAHLPEPPPRLEEAPPMIGHDVWIGQNVQLGRGITIGTGSVIAAGSVVTRDVGPYCVVGGVPARVLKMRFEAPIVQRLLASRWWEYHPEQLYRFGFKNPEQFLDGFEQAKRDGTLQPFEPEIVTWRSVVDKLRGKSFSIDPVIGGNGDPYLMSGWAMPEEHHTFSIGALSVINLPPRLLSQAKTVELDVWPPVFRPQTLKIVGAAAGRTWLLFDGVVSSPRIITLDVPPDARDHGGELLLQLHHPDFVQPAAFGHLHDTRDLSVALTRIRVLP